MDSLNLNVINDDEHPIPNQDLLEKCFALVADKHSISQAEVNVSIVSNQEIQQINKQFRHKDKPTNIISFEFEKPEGLPEDIAANFWGDIVIAPKVLKKEAKEQNKNLDDHWQHIFIHGLLHLLGYDHIDDIEAEEMENLEIELLAELGIANPYIEQEN
ncbi:rRNA maturation RNase YbeY [Francisella philomiragia]|uniref:Endoribonuclease YbeY n=1 Tax=Francisella philomiragia TaxID=28110 RepID=A0AAW3D9E9_9GAMM|nr:rRNA maturation RNase YbeY [Francisella philomiragia]KFJ42299.1 putative rRNA maturation factor YbeY [Francisella philomiragia]MBK2254235.1 rRNA maturation RNase YbeY [Francisella philomiragia]MBK2272547.1 rRNA maturation RNase YbeY [Francisella philomiragia]MBK2276389.1 rRNA maturation RNase YbeY [Francisella philomiragia]MBK2280336.1 rRNA maturation RNase YbeY [Francisella philomiragia]